MRAITSEIGTKPRLEGETRSKMLMLESGSYDEDLKRRNLNEFETTLTELIAIAPAANIGFRSPNAAIGMPMML
jgi:hypothetical protein